MPRVSAGCPAFYRSGKRCSDGLNQSGRPPTVYRILPGLLLGQGRPPPRLQPAWLLAAGGCGAGPWSGGAAGPQIHLLVVVSAPPPRRDVTYAVRHSVPLDGVLISRNAPYAADCGRCLKGVMFAWAHSFACRLRIST